MSDDFLKEMLRQAKELFDDGKLVEARAVLEEALVRAPKDSRLLNFVAYLYFRLGELELARDTYRRLTGLEPDSLTVWSNLGIIAFRLGHLEEAKGAFEEYLDRDPDNAKILGYMGKVMEALGRRVTAGRYRERAAAGVEEAEEKAPAASLQAPPPAARREPEPVQAGPDLFPGPGEWYETIGGAMEEGNLRFTPLSPDLVSIRLEERVFFSARVLTMYRGIVVFEQGPSPFGRVPRSWRSDLPVLAAAEGNGTIWLSHAAGGLVTLRLNNEALVVNAHRFVACEAALDAEFLAIGRDRFLPGLAALRFAGSGLITLAAGTGATVARAMAGTPLYVRPSRVVAWTDGLSCDVDTGQDVNRLKGFPAVSLLRLEGSGRACISGWQPA